MQSPKQSRNKTEWQAPIQIDITCLEELKLHESLKTLLLRRGYDTIEKAKDFLLGSLIKKGSNFNNA